MRFRKDDGYVLFGIAIGLVILGIAMTAAVPLWQKVVQREREKELIFRGYQYMQAIELYQKKFPGAYPPNVDVLVEQKFLRKVYKDPFSEDGEGDFRYIRQLSPELQQAAQRQQEQAAEAAGITRTNRSQAELRTPGQRTPGPRGATRSPTGGRFQSAIGRQSFGSEQGLGGIVGVASSSEEETFYKVPGKTAYKDWLFVYGVQQPGQVAGQPPGGGVVLPGQPSRLGQGPPNPMSPFPGLPPPPGLTSFRFGAVAAGGVPPGAPAPALPGRPGVGPPNQPGTGPSGRPPRQRRPSQPPRQRQR